MKATHPKRTPSLKRPRARLGPVSSSCNLMLLSQRCKGPQAARNCFAMSAVDAQHRSSICFQRGSETPITQYLPTHRSRRPSTTACCIPAQRITLPNISRKASKATTATEEEHAKDRWHSILQIGTPDHCWLRSDALAEKDLGFSGNWSVNDQNDPLARLFRLQKVNKASKHSRSQSRLSLLKDLRRAQPIFGGLNDAPNYDGQPAVQLHTICEEKALKQA